MEIFCNGGKNLKSHTFSQQPKNLNQERTLIDSMDFFAWMSFRDVLSDIGRR